MPIYEYKCANCKESFETLVFRSDEEVSCPHCKGTNVNRLMSACGFKSSGSFTPATGPSGGCSGCSSTNCSSCH
ncbi:MAG: zinc ribbon domain-containing protein [Candidatus Desulfacyla sp.]